MLRGPAPAVARTAAQTAVSVVMNDVEVTPQSITAVPGMAGVYELDVTLPEGLPAEDVPVSLKIRMPDGSAVTSNKVLVASATSR